MPMPTRIVGPYDNFPTHAKLRIHFGVPKDIVKRMFTDIIPLRGAQDKICARLFHIFYDELIKRHPHLAKLEDDVKEEFINNLLNDIAEKFTETPFN